MDAERWQQVEALFHGALERPAQERGRFLAEACESHPEICGEIESLLAQDPAAETPLDKPAWDGLASLLDEADSKPLEPGAQFGAYRIEAQIGRGGMGEVYRARDIRLNRTVAIKFCAERFGSRFAREAQAIASLNHPHICIVHDVGPNYLVMEYLEGETLAARLAKQALPLNEALPLAIQIANGLHAAHRSGVVHRDLNPANIMLTKSGAKILDFGLARMVESAPGDGGGKGAAGDTKSGVILGTVPYMAPEQLEGKHADARADLFAFGAVLYEMLTGRRAFEGNSQASLISAIMSTDPPAVTTLQPRAPAALDRVVKTCLIKDPDARWQSAHDIQLELSWLHTSRPATPVAEAAPATTKAPWRRNRTLQFGAAGALLAIALGLGVWRLRPSANPEVIPEPVPFTTKPGFAQFPAFSPDGNQIAFTWAPRRSSTASIYVKQIGGETELRVTNSPGIDVLPVWSPDGRNIAFYRRLPGRSGYYVVSALGGPERQLVQVDFPAISTSWPYRDFPYAYFWAGIDWFPDGRHVALVLPAEWSENQLISRNAVDWGVRRIVRLDIETGEQVPLTVPPAKSPFGDLIPRISPDGKRLAFVRLATDSVCIYLLDLSGTAQPRRLIYSDGLPDGLDWT